MEVVAKGAGSRRPALGRRCPLLRRVWRSYHPARRRRRCAGQVWERPGCGPAALIQAGPDFLVTCYDENTLVRVSPAGETLQVHDKDAAGAAFVGPNDFVADDEGGVFMSASGPWEIGTDRRQDPLSCPGRHPAHGRRRPSLRQRPGPLAGRQDALLLGDVQLSDRGLRRSARMAASPAAGSSPASPTSPVAPSRWRPDGLKTDAMGNLYIALYEGGQVLVADEAGKLLATIDPPAPNVSNVAFGPDQSVLLHHRRARRFRRTLAGRGLPDRQSDRSLKSALFRLICGSGSCRLADRVARSQR